MWVMCRVRYVLITEKTCHRHSRLGCERYWVLTITNLQPHPAYFDPLMPGLRAHLSRLGIRSASSLLVLACPASAYSILPCARRTLMLDVFGERKVCVGTSWCNAWDLKNFFHWSYGLCKHPFTGGGCDTSRTTRFSLFFFFFSVLWTFNEASTTLSGHPCT